MKTKIFLGALLLASSASAFATTYLCAPADSNEFNAFEMTTKQDGRINIGGKYLDAGKATDCDLDGQGGRLFTDGDGPNTYGLRVEDAAFTGAKTTKINFVFDDDSDAMACRQTVYNCVAK